ncbi:quinol:cytochrome C oxidoreductase [Flavobacteriales bacterium]|nr:quinol:cytochrome C oxidoreductase [Flavobacteriales bacterium]
MNFQFTSKIKRNLFILMAVGFILFIIGFMGEKNHLYSEVVTAEDGTESILLEYYKELPFTKEEFISKVNTAAAEDGISVSFKDMISHDANEGNAEEASHEEHEFAMLLTPHSLETAETHAHVEGHEHDGEGHGAEHGDSLDAHADEADAEGGHDAHAEVAHSPMETLEHIIHHEGAFADKGHARTWSNLLVNAFFFFGIGLGALFFIALQYATESGWGVVYKRILEGIIGWLPVGAIILTLIFFAGSMQWNHIWHWMDPEVMNPDSSHFDAIIANKQPFLSQWFFWLMNAVYFAVFLLFARGFRKRSLQEDIEGGTKIHMKNFAKGALFLVLFGYLSSVMSWHWIMSIDTHWFSTLFGWFVFSGIWVSATIFILLLVFWLKSQGYLEFINESHIHDMGKWMFAISFLWTYLFFSQFMLIWYANIPEEVTYYLDRFGNYKWILWTTVAVNFVIPIVLLMSREAKRSRPTIMIIGAILFVFHWVDVFIMIMPGSVFDHWAIGVLEVGMFVFFLGLFIFTVLRTLSKAPLLVKNHPYLDENLHHHT